MNPIRVYRPAISLIAGIGLIAFVAYGSGYDLAAKRIKATCDAPETATIFDGREYICLPKEEMKDVARYYFNLGRESARQQQGA